MGEDEKMGIQSKTSRIAKTSHDLCSFSTLIKLK
jgi:hypothetical protein